MRRLRNHTGGAVYVEFLIAFIPVLVFFLCLAQLSFLYQIKLAVEHAAVIAARSAAVVLADRPKVYGTEQIGVLGPNREDHIRKSAVLALAPYVLDGSINEVKLVFPEASQPNGPDAMHAGGRTYPPMRDTATDMVRVRVEAEARCKIALANAIMCTSAELLVRNPLTGEVIVRVPDVTNRGFYTSVKGESVFPYQGARYEFP